MNGELISSLALYLDGNTLRKIRLGTLRSRLGRPGRFFSTSADQTTEPDLAVAGPVTSFQFLRPGVFAGNALPTLDREPTARVIGTMPNKSNLKRSIGNPFHWTVTDP
ncbi:MAG: hypothetical protein DMG49_22510 [Acidobacteria bacterium]|nr:MAG: hypothetical protein DMG49_22510 [Acidobacteriota bacterium]